jgi:plastocyanin
MGINRFYERNKPIFAIATVLAIIFVGLIIFYKVKPYRETPLSKVDKMDEEFYKVAYDDTYKNEEEAYIEEDTTNQENPVVENQEPLDQNVEPIIEILEISYTSEGFSPAVTKAKKEQTVKWTNNTENPIFIHQKKQVFAELDIDVEIKPGESFSLILSKSGIWTYEEKETKHFGSIEITVPNPTVQ